MTPSEEADADASRLLSEAPCFSVLAAGAGKTELLARCARLAAADRRRTLILTHTNAGVDVLRRRIVRVGGDITRCHVTTIAAWCEAQVRNYPLIAAVDRPLDESHEGYGRTYDGALRVVDNESMRRVIRASWSLLLVDEYQDCSQQQHAVVALLARDIKTIVLGDPLQAIYTFDGDPIHWDNHVYATWPIAELSTQPRRWATTNPALGQQLTQIRERLEDGLPIDLSHYSQITWTPQNDRTRVARPKAMRTRQGTCLVLTRHSPQVQNLARNCDGIFGTLEPLATNDLQQFAGVLDGVTTPQEVLARLHTLAVSAMARLGSDFTSRCNQLAGGEIPRFRAESRLGPFTEAALAYLASGLIRDLRAVFVTITALPGVALARKELWADLDQMLTVCERGNVPPAEVAAQIRERARRRGRRPASHLIGTPLLAKGLEFDHVVVVDAHHMTRELLYVSLTRATTSLEVLSTSRVLNPNSGTS